MKNKCLSSEFLFQLEKMRTTRPALVHEISDILNMDENSVYRRLRGAVKFSVDEIGKLARHYHLSLDELLSAYPEGGYEAWKMDLLLIADKDGLDPDAIERNIPLINEFPNSQCTELGGSLGSLTRHFYMHHKHLWRFMHFKWGRYYSNVNTYSSFDAVQISPKLADLFEVHLSRWKNIKYAFFIWDSLIFQKLVNDIRYYKSMDLLTEENVLLIKQDIIELLDVCEKAAIEGRCRDIVERFEIYISPINIDTSQVYLRYGEHWNYSIEVHGIRPIITSKPNVCKEFSQSINRLKNASVLISKSAERERRRFFNQQYELLNSL
ncbi:helix-turn-helix domain-containing protein [Bacteroides sp. 51]|uniref:helix-turn-helix domain-containing protein n=1 Tax=Bacteroides sp. 51 TaxID=2302938 RepID=UPI0013D7111B|nr:helix-turn-helix domain-containing protein [Bacteroides sp. 51]NDV83849.1 hypothetical protein [Bacteroides sp. 51]